MLPHNSATQATSICAVPANVVGGKPGTAKAGGFFPGALVSCNERTSRFLLLGKVEDKKAASFNASLIPRLCKIPAALRKTLTLDNGSESRVQRAGVSHRDEHVFLQAVFAVAAWYQRERQLPVAAVFSKRNQLPQDHGRDVCRSSRSAE